MFALPEEMIVTYLKRRHADIETLRHSLHSNSVVEFNRIGHQLMGNARNYGFPCLEKIAQSMESLSVTELPYAGPRILELFDLWLKENTSRYDLQN